MLRLRVLLVVVSASLVAAQPSAQQLTYDLFARYLEPLRVQAGIPGLSAAIAQDGRVAWDRGFGFQDVEGAVAAASRTLYPVGGLSETLGATLVLQHCIERGEAELDDQVQRWNTGLPEPLTTFRQLLSHRMASGQYAYSPSRFATFTDGVAECADEPYASLAVREVLDRLAMTESVPGTDLNGPAAAASFTPAALARYRSLLNGLATPYRVDANRRATRSALAPTSLTAADGLVSNVFDLARFDDALNDGILLRADTLSVAWSRSGASPMGLGWYVQTYKNERVIWHFGMIKDAYSSLIVKVPGRGLTLILLANSDGLSSPFPLVNGDVTVSPFAKVFLGFIG